MQKLSPKEIFDYLDKYSKQSKKMFVSSSFQTHSLALLHIVSQFDNSIPVYFLNTGFHFPETLSYRDEVAELLNLNLQIITSDVPKSQQKNSLGRFYFTSDPDYCCYLNKTKPMEKVMIENDVWINGSRADQSEVRAKFKIEQPATHNAIRFHPMLGWSNKEVFQYIAKHKLPHHPLDNTGYLSIGCEPCTRKFNFEDMLDNRDARWAGLNKTECGLNTELIDK